MKNLKSLRRAKSLSQAQIASFLHIGSSTVCRWELGQTNPSLCQFLKLCKILDCTPAQLCDDISDKEIPVFDTETANITAHVLTDELKTNNCSFGIVLPFTIPPRFKKDDICYFSIEDKAETNSLVLAFDDNYTEYLCFFKETEEALHIIATCRFMCTKI